MYRFLMLFWFACVLVRMNQDVIVYAVICGSQMKKKKKHVSLKLPKFPGPGPFMSKSPFELCSWSSCEHWQAGMCKNIQHFIYINWILVDKLDARVKYK